MLHAPCRQNCSGRFWQSSEVQHPFLLTPCEECALEPTLVNYQAAGRIMSDSCLQPLFFSKGRWWQLLCLYSLFLMIPCSLFGMPSDLHYVTHVFFRIHVPCQIYLGYLFRMYVLQNMTLHSSLAQRYDCQPKFCHVWAWASGIAAVNPKPKMQCILQL